MFATLQNVTLNIELMNVRSFSTKSLLNHDTRDDQNHDFMCPCETWLKPNDFV